MRTRTLLLSATLVTFLFVSLGQLAGGGSSAGSAPAGSAPAGSAPGVTRPSSVTAGTSPGARRALAVLRGWDHRRAEAWRRGDPTALAALYTPGSRAGRRDVADLKRWRRRGLRVVGLRQQVLSLRLAHRDRASGRRHRQGIVVVVTDRAVDAVAVDAHRRMPMPQSAWATQRVSLRSTAGAWRVVEALTRPAR
jgi:hypothetical protein